MIIKRMICLTVSLLILAVSLCSCSKAPKIEETSTMKYVQNFGLGINLGNTFEACGEWISKDEVKNFETAWGSPIITREIIQGYADAGFGVVRVPVY